MLRQALSSLEEKGMQNDPRYGQLIAVANRMKMAQAGGRDPGMNSPMGGMDNPQMAQHGPPG